MIKITFQIFLLCFCLSLACCKKEEASFSGAKVITNTNMRAGYIDTYTYNSDGSVSEITRNIGGKTVFSYSGDTVLMQYISAASVVSSATRYIRQGTYADTSFGFYQAANNSAKYAYNSDGQLTQQKNYAFGSLSSTSDFTLASKNPVSITTTNAGTGTHVYTYYSYGTNSNTIGNQNFGMGFLGVGSLYLPTAQVRLAENGDTTAIISYTYHYNGDSNVDTLVTHDRNGFVIDSMAYSY